MVAEVLMTALLALAGIDAALLPAQGVSVALCGGVENATLQALTAKSEGQPKPQPVDDEVLLGSLLAPSAGAEGEGSVTWTAPWPDPAKPAAGLPVLEGTQHALIYHAVPGIGTYNHGPRIHYSEGWFTVIWYSHAQDEDSPGQRILFSCSQDGFTWSDAEPMFDSLSPVKPLGGTGVILGPGPYHEVNGRVYASASGRRIRAWTDHARTTQVEQGDRKKFCEPVGERLPRLMRRIEEGKPAGPPFWVAKESPEGLENIEPYTRLDARTQKDIAAILEREKEANLGPLPEPAEKARLCEAVHYTAPSGQEVRLFRDDLYSLRMFASVRASREEIWPTAVRTNIPDSPSLTSVGALPDGQVFLIGNQIAKQWQRDPLTIALSRDGFTFDRAWAIRFGAPEIRHKGAHKGRGYQYPNAAVVGENLWVAYSIGKEDIGVTRVPIASLHSPETSTEQ